jgi:HlyD family secretion protein
VNGEVGEYLTPSPPGIMTLPAIDLIDDTCLYVSAPIDEVDAAQLKIGMGGRITLDAYRGKHFTGKLRRIAPYVLALEKQARTVEVEVDFESPGREPPPAGRLQRRHRSGGGRPRRRPCASRPRR